MRIPLAELPKRLDELPTGQPIVAYCAQGSRSATAASLLRHAGFEDVSDLLGGYQAWQRALAAREALPSGSES